MRRSIDDLFPKGLLRPELFMGVASSITAQSVTVNLSEAGRSSGSHFCGERYGRGEVGEFVLLEGQRNLVLGRITEVRLPEHDRRSIKPDYAGTSDLDAIGQVQLLGSVAMDDLTVTAGVDTYPRLGDRVYAAPHQFIALLPQLMEKDTQGDGMVVLDLGAVNVAQESTVSIKPERLFGRHCAILGATGGGKSWTTARIIEECLKYKAKLILIDATGEYREFSGTDVVHCHLGEPVNLAHGSIHCSLPPTSFVESDFIALFEPAGKVQGPKMRAAIRSLRLAKLKPGLAPDHYIVKHGQPKGPVQSEEKNPDVASKLDNPRQPFDVEYLVPQIEQECVWPNGGDHNTPDYSKWGGSDDNSYSNCLSLFARISGVLTSPAFKCVFAPADQQLMKKIDDFIGGNEKLLRICLSGVAHEYNAREIIANAIGRYLLTKACNQGFSENPIVLIVDEAHNFLGRQIGLDDFTTRLDAFELIAKEGRKYGLNICLATQRPRDLTEGVLSQMGTLIVHRLTNDQDREVVERACGEIDRSAAAFLPNLRPGEAVIIGADFPIPLTFQVREPDMKPKSDGPKFQEHWSNDESPSRDT
jgi:hypothetical protein